MAKFKKIYTLKTYPSARAILLLGCGGTGGHLVPHLARYVGVKNESDDRRTVGLILADGDIVEEKNLKRQHFIESDIAKNKAVVMAERYSAAFGMEIKAIPKDLETADDIINTFNNYRVGDSSYLIIGCVDNNASRKIIYNWMKTRRRQSRFWIDAGNEERAGQVICGYTSNCFSYSNKVRPGGNVMEGNFTLPCVTEHYQELLSENSIFNSELSCAERAVSAPQNMQTNVTAATLAMNFARKIIDGEPLRSHGVEFNIDNVYNTKLNTVENLSVVSDERKQYWEM